MQNVTVRGINRIPKTRVGRVYCIKKQNRDRSKKLLTTPSQFTHKSLTDLLTKYPKRKYVII